MKLWDQIAQMLKMDLFRIMCMSGAFIVGTIIPTTNKYLNMPMDLHELYIWLGTFFFMAVRCQLVHRPVFTLSWDPAHR
jgi:hypothetical protein